MWVWVDVGENKRATLTLKIKRSFVPFRVSENMEIVKNTTLEESLCESTQSVQATTDINFELSSSRTGTSHRSSFASFGDGGRHTPDDNIVRYRAVLSTGATSLIRSFLCRTKAEDLTPELLRASVKNREVS